MEIQKLNIVQYTKSWQKVQKTLLHQIHKKLIFYLRFFGILLIKQERHWHLMLQKLMLQFEKPKSKSFVKIYYKSYGFMRNMVILEIYLKIRE
ncbi:unnamed protein product [Paramecium pentaurelia]|uniref:Uncharacterized protein n=1 Tax=Paramecium pentaurelia TaxID=43138 RepID=A0A8S1YM49_9CILI|nr:unnamed protein product [Paramecium pentaurelia]